MLILKKKNTVKPWCSKLYTVPDAGLEESTVPTKCDGLYTVPEAGLQESKRPKCDRLCSMADNGLHK